MSTDSIMHGLDEDAETTRGLGKDTQRWPINQSLAIKKKGPLSRNAHHSNKRLNIVPRRPHQIDVRSRSGKYWNPLFSKPRICRGQPLYERCRELSSNDGVDGERDPESDEMMKDGTGAEAEGVEDLFDDYLMSSFLGDSEGAVPSWEAKVIRQFISRKHDNASMTRDRAAWAWVDDREYCTGRSRGYRNALSVAGLHDILNKTRFGHSELPDVDRRLIYISRLTPDFVKALAVTAWDPKALRDAVWKHIALETSFRVHIPTFGFKTFRLEFHLAHLILRETTIRPHPEGNSIDGAISQSLVDLSFLDLETSAGGVSSHSIYQAHISIVICGWSDSQWTGYAFANQGAKDSPREDEEEDDDDEEYVPRRDPFAADNIYDYFMHADVQTWDARRYWLWIVAIRCQLVLKEWLYLVCTIEEGVQAWRASDPCSNSSSHTELSPKDIQKSLDRTIQIMQLLRKLLDSLSMTLRAYKRFDAPDGDKCYFLDVADYASEQNGIKETFEKMADLYLRLSSADDSCKRFATHLGRILSLESNRLTAQGNQLNQESNKVNIESNQLNKESNSLNIESHHLSERTHELNVRTSVLNDKIRELNEKSTEAACANQAAAAKTSRSTRVNVELLLFTTPFGMVLQYFGSEKDIFSFNRNPKTFILATLILMLVLRLFTLLLEHADGLLKFIPWKPPARDGQQRPPGENRDDVELEPVQAV
ncbi:uncharacterized protein K460DRAFT_417114 [Cucurbitaria berberidis CBS 394.84]|uniref:Uncharacterized protein n=1 Tax=Cucurbitaria berberidis CBS 394.84 TaxID=1168544 RepID=A0A9P4L920_9PLEO|nr:uncharacterized protein K460DRAFT_417114 [Cucurbitaria berberidis CBS 394.84]KAF1845932.1 hypothetical protein K460DRAFT_417114 [Cucurbitaria berberidis CBS 394.84]